MRLILDWLPNPNHVPLFVGIEEGIFTKHGIDLQILKVQEPGDVIPYLTSRQADIAVTYMPSLVLGAHSLGANLRVVGYLVKEPLNAIISTKSHDLDGCVMGCVTDGIQTQMLGALLRWNGIYPEKLVTVSFDLVSMLVTNQLDAVFGAYWNIEGEHIRQWGIEPSYYTMEQLGVPRHFELVLVAPKGSVSDSFIAHFKQALDESIHRSQADPTGAFDTYIKANPDKTVTTLAWERRAWEATLPVLAQHQGDEADVWEGYAGWLKGEGLIAEDVHVDGLLSEKVL
jgi:NitT/TauT family transport system substrate-binding protein